MFGHHLDPVNELSVTLNSLIMNCLFVLCLVAAVGGHVPCPAKLVLEQALALFDESRMESYLSAARFAASAASVKKCVFYF